MPGMTYASEVKPNNMQTSVCQTHLSDSFKYCKKQKKNSNSTTVNTEQLK